MVNTNSNALGVIFPNSYDALVPDLVNVRLMASIPFASRYRIIDFVLSSMVNGGIGNVAVVVRDNYYSLMDHLGSGREWDLTRKNGGLTIFPPFAEKNGRQYRGRIDAIATILGWLRTQKEKYVILSDSNIALNINFKTLLEEHVASGADVTCVYREEEIPNSFKRDVDNRKGMYYTFDLDGENVTKISVNPKEDGIHNLSMNIYIIDRELLIKEISAASIQGFYDFERDILGASLDTLKVRATKYQGYAARITDIPSYFNENMKLLEDKNLDALFAGNAIYTKIRDDNPTAYVPGCNVKNSMLADGCHIEGEVINSVLFRGVKVRPGARVSNCILMQDTIIEAGASVDHLIADKDVVITSGKEMKGSDTFPLYIAKGHTV